MEAQKSTKKFWIYFSVWFIILVALIIFKREFFWLALPGTLTYLQKEWICFSLLKAENFIPKRVPIHRDPFLLRNYFKNAVLF